MKKIIILYITISLLTGCKLIFKETNFNSWKKLALDYNQYIKNNCKYASEICEENYSFGKSVISNYEFNKFREKIIDSCLSTSDGDYLIMEKSGSGEVYYYYLYIFNLNKQNDHKMFKYDSKSGSIKSKEMTFKVEEKWFEFINNLDYVMLNDSINWSDSPRTLGIYYVSYTSITNGKLNFVKFIPKPILSAELNF